MRTLVVTPMTREARAAAPDAFVCGSRHAAARVLAHLDRQPADIVLIAGVCGGLDPSLAPGALILGRRLLAEGKPELTPHTAAFDAARRAMRRARLPFVSSSLLTVDHPIESVAARTDAWNAYGAAGVDMETYDIASALTEHNVRWLALRAVLDPAGFTLPRAVRAWSEEQDERQIARTALRSPRDWPAYARLALQLRASLRALSRAVPVARTALDATVASPDLTLPMTPAPTHT
ncbi:MAG TPA: hypothetical protein VFY79_02920 [Dehalococcoidia bacterium]|jgi:hypothetical protein|nr:hypothetical protein [Dehalococcoidia bacterium]